MRIHVWGGLGSQLFAIYLAYQISQRYPGRSLILVLHTGGVTRRLPEVCELFPEFEYREVDDFFAGGNGNSKKIEKSYAPSLKTLIRNLLLFTGLLAEENDGNSRKVRSWTLSVRGHYFHRKVSNDFLNLLYSRLARQHQGLVNRYQFIDVIHYRLGDLMALSEKKPINPSQIVKALSNLEHNEEIIVFSDSTKIAIDLLGRVASDTQFIGSDLPSSQILLAASNAKIFIGTSSKISYWIIALRNSIDQEMASSMPKIDAKIVDTVIGNEHKITYY